MSQTATLKPRVIVLTDIAPDSNSKKATVKVPAGSAGKTIHIMRNQR